MNIDEKLKREHNSNLIFDTFEDRMHGRIDTAFSDLIYQINQHHERILNISLVYSESLEKHQLMDPTLTDVIHEMNISLGRLSNIIFNYSESLQEALMMDMGDVKTCLGTLGFTGLKNLTTWSKEFDEAMDKNNEAMDTTENGNNSMAFNKKVNKRDSNPLADIDEGIDSLDEGKEDEEEQRNIKQEQNDDEEEGNEESNDEDDIESRYKQIEIETNRTFRTIESDASIESRFKELQMSLDDLAMPEINMSPIKTSPIKIPQPPSNDDDDDAMNDEKDSGDPDPTNQENKKNNRGKGRWQDDALITKDEASKDYKCTQCSYVSKGKSNINRHVIVKHLMCYKCGEGLPKNENVRAQDPKDLLKDHNCSPTNPHNCSQCDFATPRMDALKQHIKTEHAVKKVGAMKSVKLSKLLKTGETPVAMKAMEAPPNPEE